LARILDYPTQAAMEFLRLAERTNDTRRRHQNYSSQQG
jgi:hypothetical protein